MPNEKNEKYQCVCCGNYTLSERAPGTYEICSVCGWEDDKAQFFDETLEGGANTLCLMEYRKKYFEKIK